MADDDSVETVASQPDEGEDEQNEQNTDAQSSSSDSSESEYNSDNASEYDDEVEESLVYIRPGEVPPESENTPEVNIRRFSQILDSKRMKKHNEEKNESYVYHEDLFDFPKDLEYEGTIWDDLAHGKGVYVAELGLVRYEGEWLQNNMEGHGVVEVDIPDIEPVPGSN